MAIVIILPDPPSTNALFVNAVYRGNVRRVRSPAYETWLVEAGLKLNRQRPRSVTGEYALDIFVPPGRKDVGNYEKAIGDLLVKHGVTPDDKYARRVATEVVETLPAGEIQCVIRPWGEVERIADQFAFSMQAEGRR